jgi:hypothetical protein
MEIDPQNMTEEKNPTQQPNVEIVQPTNEEYEERIESYEPRVQSGGEPMTTGENTSRRDHRAK